MNVINLISPADGAVVSLATDAQRAFLASDRSTMQIEDIDWLNLKRSQSDDLTLPSPVVFTWEADGESVLEISETRDFAVARRCRGANTASVYNLKPQTRYFWRVENSETRTFETESFFPCFKYIEGGTNVRDCGNAFIKQGLLYRGAELNSHMTVTANGLSAMKNDLKIRTVLDLRGANEACENPYGGDYFNIPACAYSDYIEDRETNRKIFELLADESLYPIYFHCWGGADRTGTVAFLIGALMGVPYEKLVDDYEITSLSIWHNRSRNSEQFRSLIAALDKYPGDNIGTKVENFMFDCGVTQNTLNSLRKILCNTSSCRKSD